MFGNETYAKSIKQIMRAMDDTSGKGLEKFLIQRSADLAIPFQLNLDHSIKVLIL